MHVVMYTSSMLFSDGRDNVLPFLALNIVLSLDNEVWGFFLEGDVEPTIKPG